MTTKELIQTEIDKVNGKDLDELYGLIKDFVAAKAAPRRSGILAKLKRIQIDAHADFASNLDLSLSGEKRVEDHPH
jgi:hypothetical protein